MLSSRFAKTHGAVEKFAALKAPFHAFFASIDAFYRFVLGWAVRHRLLVGLGALASLVFMGVIGGLMGNEFVNPEDRSQFLVDIELPAGTSLEETTRLTLDAERTVLKDPKFITILSTLGPSGDVNKAKWRVVTVTKTARKESLAELKEIARAAAAKVPGARVSVADPAFIEGAGAPEAPIMVLVRARTYDDLVPLARGYEQAMKAIPGIRNVQVKYTPGRPELRVSVDRDRAARAGMPVAQIAMTLRAAMEGDEAGKLRDGKDEVPIKVRLGQGDRDTAAEVLRMTVWTPKGPMALGDLASVDRGEGPNVIERENRERQIMIYAWNTGRSLGEIVPEMEAAFAKVKAPEGSSYHFDGMIKNMRESNSSMGVALGLAVIFIYLVLASQFESFIHPLTIMLTLPLALVGAIVALFLAQETLAMGAMIGIILLMGLVTKNAILLLDRAIVRVREHGETPMQAILHAGPERLRPILMTSAAMILGMLPTAVSKGEGSEFRAPMAIAVIGGVVSSTLLSLVVVPAFYLAVEGLKARVARLFGRPARKVDAASPAE
jgi:multidrug efflux pump subunit AcrB